MSDASNKGEIKNLSGKEAVEKLKEMTEEKTCLFCTYENEKMVSRPMHTQRVDQSGSLWFMSNKESLKNLQIKKDNSVYLVYADSGKQHYLTLSGSAEILKDKAIIDELWNPFLNAWFDEGKDDPDISLIRVTPDEGHYWDTRNGKLVSLIKVAVAAITGKMKDDGGVEGKITV
jgi:general stress protein 26